MFASVAAAADLDAPLAKVQITVRSEIERGFAVLPDPIWVPINNYVEAVTALSKVNIQKNTSSPAFHYGLYYAAWHRVWSCLGAGMYRAELARREAVSDAEYFHLLSQLARKDLALSDSDVRSVAGRYYIENEEAVFADLVKTGKFHEPRPKPSPKPRRSKINGNSATPSPY